MTKERRPNSKEKQTKNQQWLFKVFCFFVFYKLKMEVLRTSVACIPSSFRVERLLVKRAGGSIGDEKAVAARLLSAVLYKWMQILFGPQRLFQKYWSL